jgi:hypothetical protein
MSDTWFEGVGVASSPFASEVEAPAKGWPSETAGLPPAWPETAAEEAEAWTPWAAGETWSPEAETGLARRQNALAVDRVPLLAGHSGRGPDLVLRWNVASLPEVIDVVVHLHGNSRPRLRLDRDVLPYSGLDLAPIGDATGQGRSRPTLAVLPRGHDTGTKQASPPHYNRYTFPALVTGNGFGELLRFALERLAAELGGRPPRVGRLILTAHSAGGRTLLQLLKHNPQQVHVFDALYQDPTALVTWALQHIQQDRAALAGLDAAAAGRYMATRAAPCGSSTRAGLRTAPGAGAAGSATPSPPRSTPP